MDEVLSEEVPNNLGLSVIDFVAVENISDVATELAEVALDVVINGSELFEAIPILSSVVKLAKAGINIRDRLFLRKLGSFLLEINKVGAAERAEYVRKLDDEPGFKKKVGENLIILLEKLDDIDKPILIGKLFRFCIIGEIDYYIFRRLAIIINRIYLPDLSRLWKFAGEAEADSRQDDPNLSLENVGLIYTATGAYSAAYQVSEAGKILIKLLYN